MSSEDGVLGPSGNGISGHTGPTGVVGYQACPTCKEPAEPRGTGWFCKKCGFRFWIDDWEDIARWNSEHGLLK